MDFGLLVIGAIVLLVAVGFCGDAAIDRHIDKTTHDFGDDQ